MLALVALAAALSGQTAESSTPADPVSVRQAYEAIRATTGRSSEDQVRLAYWSEAHGLTAERLRHLAQAVLADPTNAAARGLLGLVARDGRWMRPDAVATQQRADPTATALRTEYDRKRSATPYKAVDQFALGAWAEEHGLKEQAKAHFTASVRLDPTHEATWKRLGYTKRDGRWTTDAQLATERADAEAQKLADRKWKPLLEKWKGQLAKPNHRAEANLLTVTDPRAVPTVGKVFGGAEADQPRAVQLLGQIDAPAASRALAGFAAFGASPEVRRAATETLRRRDPREYANLLIPLIHKPIRYEVQPVNGPGSPGILYVEGDTANIKRLYEPKELIRPTDRITVDRFGQPVVERVLSSWAYSKGGSPFSPNVLTGVGSSYDDFYSSSNLARGDLSNSFNGAMAGRLPLQVVPAAAQVAAILHSPGSANELMAKLHSAATANPSKTHQVQTGWNGPGSILLSNGQVIDPRDAAQKTSAQFPLEQAVNESIRSAAVSQQQLQNDVAQIEQRNQLIRATNDRIVGLLNDATGESLSADRPSWERWYVNLLGYAFVTGQTAANPTFVEVIPSDYQPEVAPSNVIRQGLYVSGVSCFGAGTMVQTMSGPQAIETLAVGDLVLTQSVTTGALGYRPILVTHHNPPSTTFRIKLGDDEIVSSAFHRFWVVGRGWVMARNLVAGDRLRTLGGVLPVESVSAGQTELVYNLDVAEDADFFAGKAAALVHDNTLPEPRLVPFDLPTATKTVAAR